MALVPFDAPTPVPAAAAPAAAVPAAAPPVEKFDLVGMLRQAREVDDQVRAIFGKGLMDLLRELRPPASSSSAPPALIVNVGANDAQIVPPPAAPAADEKLAALVEEVRALVGRLKKAAIVDVFVELLPWALAEREPALQAALTRNGEAARVWLTGFSEEELHAVGRYVVDGMGAVALAARDREKARSSLALVKTLLAGQVEHDANASAGPADASTSSSAPPAPPADPSASTSATGSPSRPAEESKKRGGRSVGKKRRGRAK